jgi:Ca2+-binding EF-hand superfamily protein
MKFCHEAASEDPAPPMQSGLGVSAFVWRCVADTTLSIAQNVRRPAHASGRGGAWLESREGSRMTLAKWRFAAQACAVAFCMGISTNLASAHLSAPTANFRAIDTDRDSKLDRTELRAAAGRDFDTLDVDRDGFLTGDELAKTRRKTLLLPFPGRFASAAAFTAADTDRDRKIDKGEYTTAVVRAYMRCDRNRDGTIEISDLRTCSL